MDKSNFSTPLPLGQVKIEDDFWGTEQELVRREVIPYQWEALNDRIPDAAPSFCMRNFKIAGKMMREKKEQGKAFKAPSYTFRGFEALPKEAGKLEDDTFYGFVFQDSDFSKWIEAVGYSLINHPDKELERTADEAIDIVCAAQAENGYLDTYYIINGLDRIFTNLKDHHELYCFGHLLEGAISYYQATGKDKLLKAAERYADFVVSRFGPEEGKCKGYPGHEIAEMALAKLYELTNEKKYLKLAEFFLNQRGTKPYYFDAEEKERATFEGREFKEPDSQKERYGYYQAAKPVREQTEAVGHAVRAVYLYSGMADVARLSGDDSLYEAAKRLWNSIVNEKLYVTGGIGGTHLGEAFSFPFDLPNDTAYSETCAAIGLAFFARRMLEIKADSQYSDVMEQALYNTVLAGMAMDGKSFFYVNPLEVNPEACKKDDRKSHVKPVRQKWFGCACCPPNIARIVSSLGAYAVTANEETLYFHLYMSSEIRATLNGKELLLHVESGFPWNGKTRIRISATESVHGMLAFRIPGWSKEHLISMGNRSAEAIETRDGYCYLLNTWKDGDEILLDFPMEVRCLEANEKVREDAGKLAFARGPICYCAEEVDNGKDLHLLHVDTDKLFDEWGKTSGATFEMKKILNRKMGSLKIPGKRDVPAVVEGAALSEGQPLYRNYRPAKVRQEDVTITLVPYFAWNNRGEGEMSVWLRR